jgi:hypothetical protein
LFANEEVACPLGQIVHNYVLQVPTGLVRGLAAVVVPYSDASKRAEVPFFKTKY